MAFGSRFCISFDSMLLLCCVLVEATWDILLSIYLGFTKFGLDLSNHKACLLGLFIYST